ncbi:GTP cyclohydrolase FolE2 [Jannaschia aquimarina]|uniref:FolE2 protein n=1 Tax=Jannaschia aquimarina TaxID=935700 RepID=A0A0D1EJ77_9RHOB|nr:GTP cyclohydrolase FolE2 [Jannaschia aquimarina]KIT15840.1 GTP cyclohydrolase FolE2 [Jannaschia aquimarina]SNT09794.1 GTP cyclohydrolase I [Jannaschia aquimarina]
MNVHAPDIDRPVTEDEAQAALALLNRYAGQSGAAPMPYPVLAALYDDAHVADEGYRTTLPDLQNGPASLIRGADRRIQHVGISNFRLPLSVPTREGPHRVDASVTGTVSLEAGSKGINMSRIMRSFYRHSGDTMGFDTVEAALDDYLVDLGAFDARLLLRFQLPLEVTALRSGLKGWQYYDCAIEMIQKDGVRTRILHLDYVYSSTCPCSLELSEHARRERGRLATPHSQRSVARLSVEVTGALTHEDIVDACRRVVPTETQVMVKREDEQAFAELNAANPIFVEDAARLFAEALEAEAGAGAFRVVCSHQESLHSHDAVSVLTAGDLFDVETLEPRLFGTLVHPG